MSIDVTSVAFGPSERIPTTHTGEGDDVSPALSWTGLPAGTEELALICDDPDAPTPEPWVHWVLYKVQPDRTALAWQHLSTAATWRQPLATDFASPAGETSAPPGSGTACGAVCSRGYPGPWRPAG